MTNWYIVQTFSGFEQKVAEVLKETIQKKELKDTMKHLKSTFNYSGVYLTVVPTYIGGYMALTWSSNAIDISKKVNLDKHSKVINKLNTQYYTKEIHYTSFILPKWIKEI